MRSAFSSVQCTFVRHQSLPSYLYTGNYNTFLWPNKVHKLLSMIIFFFFYDFRWFLITLQSPKHSNLSRIYSFGIPNQSMSSVADHLLIVSKGKRARVFPRCRPSSTMMIVGKDHARTKRLLLPGYYNLLPCSRFTLLHSVPQSTSRSLVHTLDLIGYQRQKKLTSGFQPVLSNLQMLFFP